MGCHFLLTPFFPRSRFFFRDYTPASSAPQRSQYHSVARFSVPHSPHFKVLAIPDAPLPVPPPDAAAGLGAEVVVPAGIPGLPGGPAIRDGGISPDTDLRKAISSTGPAAGMARGFAAGEAD
jgi:hypothetical protein